MRVLCVCEGGNVRSVASAFILKTLHGVDALAVSWKYNGPQTLAYLSRFWAERILCLDMTAASHILPDYRPKITLLDVGPDRWGNPFDQRLQTILAQPLIRWVEADFPAQVRWDVTDNDVDVSKTVSNPCEESEQCLTASPE
jgi:hypothetical protein